jgi:Domain of unknown function (DUF4157)
MLMSLWGAIRSVGQAVVHTVEEGAQAVVGAATTLVRGAEEGAHAIGEAVRAAAHDAADGIEVAGQAIWTEARRDLDVGLDFVRAEKDQLLGRVGDTVKGIEEIGRGVAEIFQGRVAGGLEDIGRGVLRSTVEAELDSRLIWLRQQVSAVQTVTHLEMPSRGLDDAEKAELARVFGDEVDFSQVRIKEGNAGIASLLDQHRAFTNGNTIYMERQPSDPNWMRTLVHEMTHVWQFQHTGGGYQADSIVNRIVKGDDAAYRWEPAAAAGTPWKDLNAEQQAHLIEDGFASGMFDDPNRRFVDPTSGQDLTGYVWNAVAQLRAGSGAP